jgi:hypothetical protein
MSGRGLARVVLATLLGVVPGGEARAETATSEARAVVDRVAVRFYAPETGGAVAPRFITERVLAFEARVAAMTDEATRNADDDRARRVRSTLERHIVEEILATLSESATQAPGEDTRLVREVRADIEQRSGKENAVWIAAEEEGLAPEEVDAFFLRRARAAQYLDRSVTRFLHPSDEQLREVFRMGQHPFRDKPFEDIRGPLARWFIFERLVALESAFLQTARSRVTIVTVPR